MRNRNTLFKCVTVVLIIVFLFSAALLAVNLWERKRSMFASADVTNKVIRHNGREYTLDKNVETFLVIGIDKYNESSISASHESGTVQADFIMLFVFDNESKQTTAIHINRDTIVDVNRLDIVGNKIESEKKQIALAYNFAYSDEGKINCRNTADSVSALLMNIKVNHYVSVTMDSVPIINDAVGGVEITVADDFTGIDDTLVKGETVTLRGEQALRYVRSRLGMEDSTNIARMERQRQYLNALVDKVTLQLESDGDFALKLAEQVSPYVVYDSTEYRLKEYAERFDEYEFLGIREIEGTSEVGTEFMEFYPDEAAVKQLVIDLFGTEKK